MFGSPLRTLSSPIWDIACHEALRPGEVTESTQPYPSGQPPRNKHSLLHEGVPVSSRIGDHDDRVRMTLRRVLYDVAHHDRRREAVPERLHFRTR